MKAFRSAEIPNDNSCEWRGCSQFNFCITRQITRFYWTCRCVSTLRPNRFNFDRFDFGAHERRDDSAHVINERNTIVDGGDPETALHMTHLTHLLNVQSVESTSITMAFDKQFENNLLGSRGPRNYRATH